MLAPPAPRSEDIARVRARKSQEEDEVVTFDTVMPNTIAQFDDELQTIAGTLTDATDLTAGGRRLLNRAADQVTATKARVNTCGRRSRPRIDIDGGRPVPGAHPLVQLDRPRPHQLRQLARAERAAEAIWKKRSWACTKPRARAASSRVAARIVGTPSASRSTATARAEAGRRRRSPRTCGKLAAIRWRSQRPPKSRGRDQRPGHPGEGAGDPAAPAARGRGEAAEASSRVGGSGRGRWPWHLS